MCAAVVERNYRYYDNGAYELESRLFADGRAEQVLRHITGPIPQDDLKQIVNNPEPIDPNAVDWQESLRERLRAANFNVEGIINGVPIESGVTWSAFAKSFLNWKTAAKAAAIGGGVAFIAVSPGLVAKYTPSVASKLKWPLMGTESIMSYSKSRWWAIVKPITPTAFEEYLLAVGQSYVITKVSIALFNRLNETVGPKGFRAWRAEKMNIIIQNQEQIIPEAFVDDPVLNLHECSITNLPIRVPCRTRYGHIFEEAAIYAWIAHQIAHDLEPTCPLTRGPLTFDDLQIDRELSDTIELRLLLLKSQQN